MKSGRDDMPSNLHKIAWVQLKHDAQIKIAAATQPEVSPPTAKKARQFGPSAAVIEPEDDTDEVIKTGAKELQQDALLLVKAHREKCNSEGTNWKVSPNKQQPDAFDKLSVYMVQHIECERKAQQRIAEMDMISKIERLTVLRSAALDDTEFQFYQQQIVATRAQINRMTFESTGAGGVSGGSSGVEVRLDGATAGTDGEGGGAVATGADEDAQGAGGRV